MISTSSNSVNCYLAFSSSNRWFFMWAKEGFQHVSIFYEYDFGFVEINPCTSHIEVNVHDCHDIRLIDGDFTAIVPVLANIDPNYIYSRITIGTCVDTAKRLLGIKKLWIFTPYQLYRYLHGNGKVGTDRR